MAVSVLSQFRAIPGRGQEFLKIVGEAKAVNERLGAKVIVRQTVFGGELAGVIIVGSLFESEESHAEFTERLLQEQDHPLFVMSRSANPPATLLSRSLNVEITPRPFGRTPTVKPLSTVSVFRRSGNFDEVQAALARAQELHESLGATVTVWRPQFAGSNAGTIAYLQGHDGFTARAQFATKLAQANQGKPGPIGQLIRSGAITPVSSGLSVEVDV